MRGPKAYQALVHNHKPRSAVQLWGLSEETEGGEYGKRVHGFARDVKTSHVQRGKVQADSYRISSPACNQDWQEMEDIPERIRPMAGRVSQEQYGCELVNKESPHGQDEGYYEEQGGLYQMPAWEAILALIALVALPVLGSIAEWGI